MHTILIQLDSFVIVVCFSGVPRDELSRLVLVNRLVAAFNLFLNGSLLLVDLHVAAVRRTVAEDLVADITRETADF